MAVGTAHGTPASGFAGFASRGPSRRGVLTPRRQAALRLATPRCATMAFRLAGDFYDSHADWSVNPEAKATIGSQKTVAVAQRQRGEVRSRGRGAFVAFPCFAGFAPRHSQHSQAQHSCCPPRVGEPCAKGGFARACTQAAGHGRPRVSRKGLPLLLLSLPCRRPPCPRRRRRRSVPPREPLIRRTAPRAAWRPRCRAPSCPVHCQADGGGFVRTAVSRFQNASSLKLYPGLGYVAQNRTSGGKRLALRCFVRILEN